MATSIPADLQTYITATIGHDDYAPYVLDGQTSTITGDDDWHDVIVVEEAATGNKITKFTLSPDRTITHYAL